MMNKKIIVISVFVIIIVLFLIFCIKKNLNPVDNSDNGNLEKTEIKFDEEKELYYIQDSEGNIISASSNIEDLEFWEKHPDYNPNPLIKKSTDLEDYLYVDKEE